jgi:hypothetical protein
MPTVRFLDQGGDALQRALVFKRWQSCPAEERAECLLGFLLNFRVQHHREDKTRSG